jgi:septin family protein
MYDINTDSQIDIVVLKKLAEVVNVVPVIAKSDSLTLEERYQFKQRVSCARLISYNQLTFRSWQRCSTTRSDHIPLTPRRMTRRSYS